MNIFDDPSKSKDSKKSLCDINYNSKTRNSWKPTYKSYI